MTYKDGPRTGRIKIFITAADPSHMYSDEAERAIGKNFGFHGLYKNMATF